MSDLPISIDDVRSAAALLQGVAHRTPVHTSREANARSGAEVFFKCENLQRGGAFKFRGAYNALARLSPAQRTAGVACFSSGNHGQAVAMAARLLGIPAVVVMPADAPQAKRDATRAQLQDAPLGSELRLFNRATEDREAITRALASERGMALVPPFNHPHVMAGQGTAALELLDEVGPLDALLVCLGGGGLTAGCATVAAALAPACAVWGVEPEAGNDVQQSLAAGRIVSIPLPATLADGAMTTACGELTFAVMQARLRGVLTASDAELAATVRFFAQRMKLVVEPTGALAAAALLHDATRRFAGQRVGVIVSGGNIDLAQLANLLAPGPGVPGPR